MKEVFFAAAKSTNKWIRGTRPCWRELISFTGEMRVVVISRATIGPISGTPKRLCCLLSSGIYGVEVVSG